MPRMDAAADAHRARRLASAFRRILSVMHTTRLIGSDVGWVDTPELLPARAVATGIEAGS